VWEVRVVVGFDPGRARSIQRSFTVRGDADLAVKARRELVAEYGSTRGDIRCMASAVTVGELLEGYLGSAQLWKPATAVSHHHVVSALGGDPLCRCRLQALLPAVMRAAICRWRDEGVSVPKVSARWLLLRGAVSWAAAEGPLRLNPLARMRGPPRPQPGATTARTSCAAFSLPRVTPSRQPRMRSLAGLTPQLAPGGCSPPSSRCCWSAWPRTQERGGASWPCCGCRTWTAGFLRSSAACRLASSAWPSRAGAGG
jgi:hypothetical protein